MGNQTKIISIIIILFFSFVLFSSCSVWKDAEKSAELSCLGSIHTTALKALKSDQIKLSDKVRELTKDEIRTLVNQGKIGDCGGKKYIFENVHIEVGDKNKSSIRVWTNGNDGISGTNDDVIIPYEENSD